jgi:hypothetical protein
MLKAKTTTGRINTNSDDGVAEVVVVSVISLVVVDCSGVVVIVVDVSGAL